MRTEDEVVKEYKSLHPEAYRISRIIGNSGSSNNVGFQHCNICGELGFSWSKKWSITKRAMDWANDHRNKHLEEEPLVTLVKEVVRC